MNPKITKFMEDNKDMTLIGLAWAMWWRIYLILFGVFFALGIVVSFIDAF